jgi:hypothetical protein
MMCHRYRNQSTHFRPESLRGNLSVYTSANELFTAFELPPTLFFNGIVRGDQLGRMLCPRDTVTCLRCFRPETLRGNSDVYKNVSAIISTFELPHVRQSLQGKITRLKHDRRAPENYCCGTPSNHQKAPGRRCEASGASFAQSPPPFFLIIKHKNWIC